MRRTLGWIVSLLAAFGLGDPSCAETPAAWKDPSPHTVRFVQVEPDVRLEVLDWGGTGQAVILLAGSGLSAHVFDEFAPKLATFAHVYGISRRGYGQSSRPPAGYHNQRLADDIVRAIDALALAKPVLAGHSMAGGEITTVANQHSDRLGGLVYIDALGDPRGFPAGDPEYRKLAQRVPPPPYRSPMTDEESETFEGFRAWQMRNERFALPESELRQTFAANPDGTRGAVQTSNAIHRAIGDGEIARDYSRIRVPVLAFVDRMQLDPVLMLPGEFRPSDPEKVETIEAFVKATVLFIDRWIAHIKRDVPSARIVNLAGAGHFLFMTRESDVLFELQRFLQGLPGPAVPRDAVTGVLDAFRTHSVVTISDGRAHGDEAGHQFRMALLRDPRLGSVVNDIVLEGASARYQETVDRYVRGEVDLSADRLQEPWTESTQAQLVLGTLSGLDRVLTAVREVNARRRGEAWVRVLLADPPIDWSTVRSAADHRRWIEQRDLFAADLIGREVISRGRKALVIFGGGHLQRRSQQANYVMTSPLAQTVVTLLEQRLGRGRVFVARSEYEFAKLQPDVEGWPVPSLAPIEGTALGAAPEPAYAEMRAAVRDDGGLEAVPRERWTSIPLDEQFDAVLYLGPLTAITDLGVSDARCRDRAYMERHLARMALVGLPPAAIDQVRTTCRAFLP